MRDRYLKEYPRCAISQAVGLQEAFQRPGGILSMVTEECLLLPVLGGFRLHPDGAVDAANGFGVSAHDVGMHGGAKMVVTVLRVQPQRLVAAFSRSGMVADGPQYLGFLEIPRPRVGMLAYEGVAHRQGQPEAAHFVKALYLALEYGREHRRVATAEFRRLLQQFQRLYKLSVAVTLCLASEQFFRALRGGILPPFVLSRFRFHAACPRIRPRFMRQRRADF